MESNSSNTGGDLRPAVIMERRLIELEAALAAQYCGVVQQRLSISPDDNSSFRVGFHSREFNAEGVPFRALVSGEWAEIRCRIDRTVPVTFAIAFDAADAPLLDGLAAWVDYAAAPLQRGEPEAGVVILQGSMPALAGRRSAVITLIDGAEAPSGPRLRGVRITPLPPQDAMPAAAAPSAPSPAAAEEASGAAAVEQPTASPRAGARGAMRARK